MLQSCSQRSRYFLVQIPVRADLQVYRVDQGRSGVFINVSVNQSGPKLTNQRVSFNLIDRGL
jgi:hypothetical protein